MEILRETFFIQGLAAALIIGILSKVMVWRSYRKLLRASREMDRPQRRWIGVLKKKFENYYQLDADVHNTGCIVDQYFESHKLLGITITFWEQIPGFCAILCMLLGCAGAAMGIAQGADIFLWLRSLMVSAVVGFIIFMIDGSYETDDPDQSDQFSRKRSAKSCEQIDEKERSGQAAAEETESPCTERKRGSRGDCRPLGADCQRKGTYADPGGYSDSERFHK